MTHAELKRFLRALVEGYEINVIGDDRHACVRNPKYQPDNGSDPWLVLDVENLAIEALVRERDASIRAELLAHDARAYAEAELRHLRAEKASGC